MSDYPRVQVTNAPGLKDFEADLIMEVPRADGVMVCIVVCIVGDTETKETFVIESRYVKWV